MNLSARDVVARRAAELGRRLPVGTSLSDARIIAMTSTPNGCLLEFTWRRDRTRYALSIDLTDVSHDLFYATPVSGWPEWLDHVEGALLAHLDGGLVENSRRTLDGDRVLLDPDDGWQYAGGIDYAVLTDLEVQTRAAQLPPGALRKLVEERSDRAFECAVIGEDGPSGQPLVLALVTSSTEHGAARVELATADGTSPGAEALGSDALHLACHEAMGLGFTAVLIDSEIPGAARVGFRTEREHWRVDAPLLREASKQP